MNEERGLEEEERTVVDTTKVFGMSMDLGNGGMLRRDIKRGGSTKGAINTCTILGSSGLFLIAGAKSINKFN